MARYPRHPESSSGSISMNWWSPYVGLPFQEYHCWAVVAKIYRERLGIVLPVYEISAADYKNVHRAMEEGQRGEHWQAIDDPKEYDVALMSHTHSSLLSHVGLMVNSRHVLHTSHLTSSVVVPINHFSVKNRILGFRRHTT